jgi:hypothetical protein
MALMLANNNENYERNKNNFRKTFLRISYTKFHSNLMEAVIEMALFNKNCDNILIVQLVREHPFF